MIDYIVYFFAFMITIPVIPTFIAYSILIPYHSQKWRAFHGAVHWTTIFYILSVNAMLSQLFEQDFFSFIALLLLSILTVIVIYQWKNKTEVHFGKAIKLMWRIAYLLFFILYGLLVLYGISERIFF